MIFGLTVNGAAQQLKAKSLRIQQTVNHRASAQLTIMSKNGSYRPPIDAEIIITVDGVRLFGGVVTGPSEQGLTGGAGAGIETSLAIADFHTYAERRLVNGTYPAGSLKSMLQVVADYLNIWGVTLDPSQVDGPTLPDLPYEYVKATDVLNELMTRTAEVGEPYVWEIDEYRVLRAYQPSTVPAPFDLVGNALPNVLGDVTVDIDRNNYANVVIVLGAPITETNRVETFTGDGTTTVFSLDFTPTSHRGYVEVDGIYETLRTFGDPASWTLDVAARTLTRDAGAPANGAVISFTFDGTFRAVAIASDAGEIGTWGYYETKVTPYDSVQSDAAAQAMADAELASRLLTNRTVRYTTTTPGLKVGQSQTITIPARDLDGAGVITDIEIRELGAYLLAYDVTVLLNAQTNLSGRSWQSTYRNWDRETSGSGGATVQNGDGAVAQVGPAQPDTAVQWNNGGRFGGDGDFVYRTTQKTLIVGEGNSITAPLYSHVYMFGQNCTLAEP